MKKNFIPWITIIRPLNLAIIVMTIIMGYLCGSEMLNWKTIYFSFPLVLIAGAFYIINDIRDIKEDSINRPDRILVRKAMTVKQAGWYSLILITTAFLSLITYPLWLLFLAILALTLWLYNLKLKSLFLIGNLITALVSSIPVIWGAAITGNINHSAWIIFSLAVLLHLTREIIKDIDDYPGDLESGKKTTAVALGINISRIISLIILIPCSFLMIMIIVYSNQISFYWLIPQIVLILILLSNFWLILKNKFRTSSSLIRIIMMIEVIILITAFTL